MDINMVDVTIHIDESLDHDKRKSLVETLRKQEGVISVGHRDEKPHLLVVEYNPDQTSSKVLLERVKSDGIHAELVGL
jgi:hypothetical protein